MIACVRRFCTTQSLPLSLTTSCPWEPASPPKPEPKQQQQQREHSPAAPQDEDKEVASEESNVELDMEGIVKKPNPEEAHEMVSVWN